MSHWKTSDIIAHLTDSRWKITVCGFGGDYDTNCLQLEANDRTIDSTIYVSGFTTRQSLEHENHDDCDIEMIEVQDGEDSRGGFNGEDEATGIMYAVICTRLRKAGFDVVNTIDEYF